MNWTCHGSAGFNTDLSAGRDLRVKIPRTFSYGQKSLKDKFSFKVDVVFCDFLKCSPQSHLQLILGAADSGHSLLRIYLIMMGFIYSAITSMY
jgi:hypothetical protein